MPAGAAVVGAQRGEQQEKTGENETKIALGRDLPDLLASLKLVCAEIAILHALTYSITGPNFSRSLRVRAFGCILKVSVRKKFWLLPVFIGRRGNDTPDDFADLMA
jgi:hypothetical protein